MSITRVLITGATGHIGFRTLVLALQAGYHAHVTTRSEQQWETILNAKSIAPFKDNIAFFTVPDMTAADAYDKAIDGVQAVLHLASPIANGSNAAAKASYQELFYDPAKKGTLAIMEEAAKTPTVKRVVITSTVVVLEPKNGQEFAGPHDIKSVVGLEAANKITDYFEAYTMSKVMAHTSADDFVKSNAVGFDLVRVHPGYTMGANELVQTRSAMANGTNGALIATALGQLDDGPKLTGQSYLEDVAVAHVHALKPEIASDGDNLVIAGNRGVGIPWDVVATEIEKQFPDAVARGELRPSKGQKDLITKLDVRSSEKALGRRFSGVEEMVRSVISQYLALPE